MQKEIAAAVKAAAAYKPRNAVEDQNVKFIRAALQDADLRASMLDDIVAGHNASERLRAAEAELAAAQQG